MEIKDLLDQRDAVLNEARSYYRHRVQIGQCIEAMQDRAYKTLAATGRYDGSGTGNLWNALQDTAPILYELDYIFRKPKFRRDARKIKSYDQSEYELERIYERLRDFKAQVAKERINAAALAYDELRQVNNAITIFYGVRFEANINETLKRSCDQSAIDYCFNQPPAELEQAWHQAVIDGRGFIGEVIRHRVPEVNTDH